MALSDRSDARTILISGMTLDVRLDASRGLNSIMASFKDFPDEREGGAKLRVLAEVRSWSGGEPVGFGAERRQNRNE